MDRVLSCNCGNKITVVKSQAGRQIPCPACGATLQIPTLRGLAELPLASESSAPTSHSSGSQSPWQWRGPIMAICALVMLVSLASSGYFLWNWSKVNTSMTIDDLIAPIHRAVDEADPKRLSEMWDQYTTVSLRKPTPPLLKRVNQWANDNLRYGVFSAGIAGLMLLVILALWISATIPARRAS